MAKAVNIAEDRDTEVELSQYRDYPRPERRLDDDSARLNSMNFLIDV